MDNTIDMTTQNVYYLNHKDERITYQMKYNEKYKEKIKDYQKEYYKKTKEAKLKKQAVHNNKEIECECGIVYKQSNKTSHMRTKKHARLLNEKTTGGVGVSPSERIESKKRGIKKN